MKQFGNFKKAKGNKPLLNLPQSNSMSIPAFGNFTKKKKHKHATIKSLEKQMKHQFFWNSNPDKNKAMSIIDDVMNLRQKKGKKKR